MEIPPGATLRVERTDGKKFKGKLVRVSQDTLALSQGAVEVDIDRAAVSRIHRSRRGSAIAPVVSGAALGTIPGIIIGRIVAPETGMTRAAAVGAFRIGVGAGIGALVWALYKPKVLIHDAAAAGTAAIADTQRGSQ